MYPRTSIYRTLCVLIIAAHCTNTNSWNRTEDNLKVNANTPASSHTVLDDDFEQLLVASVNFDFSTFLAAAKRSLAEMATAQYQVYILLNMKFYPQIPDGLAIPESKKDGMIFVVDRAIFYVGACQLGDIYEQTEIVNEIKARQLERMNPVAVHMLHMQANGHPIGVVAVEEFTNLAKVLHYKHTMVATRHNYVFNNVNDTYIEAKSLLGESRFDRYFEMKTISTLNSALIEKFIANRRNKVETIDLNEYTEKGIDLTSILMPGQQYCFQNANLFYEFKSHDGKTVLGRTLMPFDKVDFLVKTHEERIKIAMIIEEAMNPFIPEMAKLSEYKEKYMDVFLKKLRDTGKQSITRFSKLMHRLVSIFYKIKQSFDFDMQVFNDIGEEYINRIHSKCDYEFMTQLYRDPDLIVDERIVDDLIFPIIKDIPPRFTYDVKKPVNEKPFEEMRNNEDEEEEEEYNQYENAMHDEL